MSATSDEPKGIQIFRPEAIAHRDEPGANRRLLRIEDDWAHSFFWLVLFAAVLMTGFACAFRVFEYASGPAVVRLRGARTITVTRGGIVDSVVVEPGQAVSADAPLLRLHDAEEVAELSRIDGEIESNLVRLLREPGNVAVKEAMTGLAARRDKAAAILRERVVVSPIDGIVNDVRVQHQQHVTPGDRLVSIAPSGSSATLTAVLPGRYRPLLHEGQIVRFSLDGAPYEYINLVVDRVGSEVIGPEEVRRYLGLSSAVPVDGPSVLVHGTLPAEFTSRGEVFRFSEGLTGNVNVRVRSESIVLALLPSLRALWQSAMARHR